MNVFDTVMQEILTEIGDEATGRELVEEFSARRVEYAGASSSEVMAGFQRFLNAKLAALQDSDSSSSSSSAKEEITLTAEQRETLRRNKNTVERFLDGNNWHYETKETRPDVTRYQLDITSKEKVKVTMKVFVETDPDVIRIEAILPFSCDAKYAYPLCVEMAKENYNKRYGCFKYDERDGEMSFEYAVRAKNPVEQDDLDIYFNAVFGCAARKTETLRRYCFGMFEKEEKNKLLDAMHALIDAL